VVSFLSWRLFERQPQDYKESILDKGTLRVSIEAASTFGWARYADLNVGIDCFGISAPGKDAYAHFGFTAKQIFKRVENALKIYKK